MKDQYIKPLRADSEEARITLEQFCAIYQLSIRVFSTLDNNVGASLAGVSIIDGSIAAGAVGFGDTTQAAKDALMQRLNGNHLKIRKENVRTVFDNTVNVLHYFKFSMSQEA